MEATKPTKKMIMDRLAELRTYYSRRNILFDKDDQYYELLFRDELGLPEEYKEDGIVLPTTRDIVDAGTNHISTVYARFIRPMRGTGPVAAEQAEMLRKFDTAMFYRTKVESDISPWRVAAKHGCEYGMWCLESVYDPDKMPDEPEQREDESDKEFEERTDRYTGELYDALPIVIRAVHPRNVYPDPAGQYMIIEEPKTILQVGVEWGEAARKRALVSSIVSKVLTKTDAFQVIYFDKNWRAIYVNGEPVLSAGDEEGVIAHDYGHIPYVVGYSGLGNMDKSSKPEVMAVGLIRYLKGLLRSESFAYSVYNITIKQHSWPITFVSGPGAATVAAIKMKYGKIYEKPPGVTIEDYVKAAPPEIVMQHMEYTGAILAASAAPRSVRGLPESGVRSGADRSLVISQARLRYDGIMEQMQLSTAKVMSNCTKVLERVLPTDIHIWAKLPDEEFDVKIDRSRIRHHYTTFVEFTPVSPEEEARRHADMMNLVKVGVISSSTGRRRYLSHIDPEAEDIKVEAEKLRNDPSVRSVLAQIVAAELAGEAARLTKIKQLQAGNLPNQAALSMPGGAQQLSAMGQQVPAGTPQQAQMPGSQEDIMAKMIQARTVTQGGSLPGPKVVAGSVTQ